jgi:hypothetical protein
LASAFESGDHDYRDAEVVGDDGEGDVLGLSGGSQIGVVVDGNSLSAKGLPVSVITARWMVSRWVSAPMTTREDAVTMVVSLLVGRRKRMGDTRYGGQTTH